MINTRPVFLLVLMALIPAVLFGGFFASYVLEQQRAALEKQLVDRATTISAAVERELSTQIQLLSILSESPRLDPPISLEKFREIAERLRARVPDWSLLRVSDLEGNVLATVPSRDAKQVADKSSLIALAAADKPVIGNISMGRTGNWGFPVRVPVTRDGRTVAALTAVLRPAAIAHLIRQNIPPGEWRAWVLDAAGNMVGATDPLAPMGKSVSSYAQIEQPRVPLSDAKLGDGEDLRVAYARVEGTEWAAAVAVPQSQYQALTVTTAVVLAVTCLVTLFFSSAAIFMFNRELAQRREQELAVATAQRSEALGKLTGQVAHDFNNLLMVFQSGATAISRRPNDHAKVLKVIDSMHHAVGRGKEITQRLLSFSSRSTYALETVELAGAIRRVKPLLQQAANDGISIEYAVEGNLWSVKLDPAGFENALINLVTNSREAMPGGGQITIRARNIEDAGTEQKRLRGPHVAVTISDSGAGIAPEHISKVFEPLYSTKRGGAVGLGLTQVSNFARRSGGVVTISSVVSVGTSVTLYLPAATDQMTRRGNEDEESDVLPRYILIVDDTPASLEAARLTIEGEAVEVITARDGKAALEVLARQPRMEALLSDIMMPGMSGIELAAAAKSINPHLKIVLMTGYSDRLEQGEVVDCPVVTKPFVLRDLATAFGSLRQRMPDNAVALADDSN